MFAESSGWWLILCNGYLSGMGATKEKGKRSPVRKRAAKVSRAKSQQHYVKLFDAKKFEGTVPAFANVTLEEMRAWRDDR